MSTILTVVTPLIGGYVGRGGGGVGDIVVSVPIVGVEPDVGDDVGRSSSLLVFSSVEDR